MGAVREHLVEIHPIPYECPPQRLAPDNDEVWKAPQLVESGPGVLRASFVPYCRTDHEEQDGAIGCDSLRRVSAWRLPSTHPVGWKRGFTWKGGGLDLLNLFEFLQELTWWRFLIELVGFLTKWTQPDILLNPFSEEFELTWWRFPIELVDLLTK